MMTWLCHTWLGDSVKANNTRISDCLFFLISYLLKGTLEDFLSQIDIIHTGIQNTTEEGGLIPESRSRRAAKLPRAHLFLRPTSPRFLLLRFFPSNMC
jgi:hypothetical protein